MSGSEGNLVSLSKSLERIETGSYIGGDGKKTVSKSRTGGSS